MPRLREMPPINELEYGSKVVCNIDLNDMQDTNGKVGYVVDCKKHPIVNSYYYVGVVFSDIRDLQNNRRGYKIKCGDGDGELIVYYITSDFLSIDIDSPPLANYINCKNEIYDTSAFDEGKEVTFKSLAQLKQEFGVNEFNRLNLPISFPTNSKAFGKPCTVSCFVNERVTVQYEGMLLVAIPQMFKEYKITKTIEENFSIAEEYCGLFPNILRLLKDITVYNKTPFSSISIRDFIPSFKTAPYRENYFSFGNLALKILSYNEKRETYTCAITDADRNPSSYCDTDLLYEDAAEALKYDNSYVKLVVNEMFKKFKESMGLDNSFFVKRKHYQIDITGKRISTINDYACMPSMNDVANYHWNLRCWCRSNCSYWTDALAPIYFSKTITDENTRPYCDLNTHSSNTNFVVYPDGQIIAVPWHHSYNIIAIIEIKENAFGNLNPIIE